MEKNSGCGRERIEQMIRHTIWAGRSGGVVIGLSGGVDSAVAAALCVHALGKEHVKALLLPTSVTPPEDLEDATGFCRSVGIDFQIIPIDGIVSGVTSIHVFPESDYSTGNLMARVRMALLYYCANAERRLVCGTSNRSEYMLGYCTKHGDSAADFQPILHLYKTQVFSLAEELGIPESIRTKPPSAGLWKGQLDEKEIGIPYRDIDDALMALEQQEWVPATATQEKVLTLVKSSEHKRLPPPSLLGSG
ncbi:MAG: NAD+ synthase [Methanomicrobiales archaeon]|nr:NAD+ synthase [Methanomicrobiales archaeon]